PRRAPERSPPAPRPEGSAAGRSGCRCARRAGGRPRTPLRRRSRPPRAARRRASTGTRWRRPPHRRGRPRARARPRGRSSPRPAAAPPPDRPRSQPPLPEGQIVEAGGLFGEGGALALVERDLERPEPEEGALEPDRRERDPDLVEELVLRERGHLGRAPALAHL